MKFICETAGAFIIVFFLFISDIPYLSEKLVPEAQALWGRGAAFVVGAAAGSAISRSSGAAASQQQAAAAQQQAASSQQQATAAQQQAAASQQQAAAAQQQAAASQSQAGASGSTLPLGTVVSTLPGGCTPTPIGGVTYYYCGGNFYQAVYEGSTLKYVTTKPK
jgi:hypothetical protein